MYSMPVIPSDLRHEETITQATSALENLQKIINSVFNTINARIKSNNKKISSLGCRIDSANKKITNLIGSNKAIQIFSPSKFPSSNIFVDIPLTFYENGDFSQLDWNKEYEIKSSLDPINNKSINEKLLYFHVRNSKKNSSLSKTIEHRQGLGRIPKGVKSVNSLLLYNTSTNVYTDAKIIDLIGMKKEKNKLPNKVESNQVKIEAAPLSVTNRQHGDKKLNEGFFYTPKLNEAPEIDLPIDLPDLPGIADDVQFKNVANQEIAPSLFIENLSDLPEPDEEVIDLNLESTDMAANKLAAEDSTPTPPSPPKPTDLTESIPKPPPPPSFSIASTQDKIPEVTDARTSLMDAIRKAGGTRGGKLRAAEDFKRNSDSKTEVGDDFMADLHKVLSIRQKAISGALNKESVNIMDRISSLIPPPPKPQQHSTTDEEDEDNQEWEDKG